MPAQANLAGSLVFLSLVERIALIDPCACVLRGTKEQRALEFCKNAEESPALCVWSPCHDSGFPPIRDEAKKGRG